MRKSVLTVLTPRRIRSLEPQLRANAEEIVLGFRDEPVIDLLGRLAFPFPGFVAFSLIGFPPGDIEQLKEWSAIRVQLTYGRLSEAEQVAAARTIVEFWNYCEAHVDARKAQRADDMTSDLLDLADEKPEQLNEFDIVNMVYAMALAGHETTCNAIANAMRNLLPDRIQWQRLIDAPELIPNAVEEALRYEGPLLHHRRIAKVDTEIGGVRMPAGAKVMMSFAAAGRDPEVFADPEVLDIGRENAGMHLQFGKGAHFCLGAPLARLEMRIVLELLTTLTPGMALVPDQVFEYYPKATGRNLKQLLVAPQGVR
jgi:cytochrome P450